MKKLLLISILFTSCTKENFLQTRNIGQLYHIKDNVFNKGTYQPKQPVRVEDLNSKYSTSNIIYYNCTDMDGVVWIIPTEDLK